VDLVARVHDLVEPHPAVRAVRLAGSRARGEATELSDWDFEVETDDFDSLARDLPELVAPLEPLGQLWDPYAVFDCYMLMLRGAVKVDFLFPDRPLQNDEPWGVSAETLPAIDTHFWDWILWIRQKQERDPERVPELLAQMHRLMLGPMAVEAVPQTVDGALAAYVAARDALERRYDVRVDRRLEHEVLARVRERPGGRPA
jgi:hypothetical protein